MRVKQYNEFGPIRAPEKYDFWRPTTAKLPLPISKSRLFISAKRLPGTYALLLGNDGDYLQQYNLWTAALNYSPHPIVLFLCCRVEPVEPGCSIDHTSILIGQHL